MADGAKVTVYTTDPCGFCRQAKALLESRGVDYEEISLTKDPDGRARLVQRTGQMTFPQIIAGGRVIGGFRELLEADRDGTLTEILSLERAA
jgi:glutaredoxin 3